MAYKLSLLELILIGYLDALKGKKCRRLFNTIIQCEKSIFQSNNKEVVFVYKRFVSSSRTSTLLYLVGIIFVVIFYIAAPLLRDGQVINNGNETVIVKQVPLSSWSPFDENNNYWKTFIWTSLVGTYLSIFFVTADLICFSLIGFAICKIAILNHFITNFKQYAEKRQKKLKCDTNNSYRFFQTDCILFHQNIIRYVENLNYLFKYVILWDFLQSSIQLTGIIYQLTNNLAILQCILLGEFTLTLTARIYIYYSNAHELTVQSQDIANAWFQSNWSEFPHNVQKNIVICIIRSQKSLKLTIGGFQAMSLQTFIEVRNILMSTI